MEYAGIGDKKGIYFIDDLPYLPYRYEKIYNKGGVYNEQSLVSDLHGLLLYT